MYTKEHKKQKQNEFANFCKLKSTTSKNINTKVHKNLLLFLKITLSAQKHFFFHLSNLDIT